MKKRTHELSEKARIETLDALYTTAASLKGHAAMKLFLRDLLTESERLMLGRRILIARRLVNGESVTKIAEDLEVGFDTIYRIERWLHDQIPGYETALKGLAHVQEKRKRKYENDVAFSKLKKKYPLHFLFFADPLKARKK